MMNSELYNAIFKRRSIRKYDMTPLPAYTLSELQKFAGSVKPLDPGIKYQFSYLGEAEVKNLLPIKAPHYICIYSEKRDRYLMNAGFLLQQIDLYLSANNIASCWLGMAKPAKEVPEKKNGLEYVIMLAFGNTSERLHRTDKSEFLRKSISEISTAAVADELLEPVRLSPSASNSQPWFFSGDEKEIIVSRQKLNLIRAPLYGRFNQMDIGIALCHLWLSLDHLGKEAIFDFGSVAVPNGYEFMAKIKTFS